MVNQNAAIAHKAFEALGRQDISDFGLLCDSEVELYRFTAPPRHHAHNQAEFALVPLCGREAIAAWLQQVFDAFPGMRFLLEAVDEVGDSVVCDARFSFGEDPPWPWTFVLTMHKAHIVGFEVFHPEVEGIEHGDRYSVAWGQFRVRGRASAVTAPRTCAWVFHKDESGVPTSVRIYPTKAKALEAVTDYD
jgi:ketosteroid isomerase-like protein